MESDIPIPILPLMTLSRTSSEACSHPFHRWKPKLQPHMVPQLNQKPQASSVGLVLTSAESDSIFVSAVGEKCSNGPSMLYIFRTCE